MVDERPIPEAPRHRSKSVVSGCHERPVVHGVEKAVADSQARGIVVLRPAKGAGQLTGTRGEYERIDGCVQRVEVAVTYDRVGGGAADTSGVVAPDKRPCGGREVIRQATPESRIDAARGHGRGGRASRNELRPRELAGGLRD